MFMGAIQKLESKVNHFGQQLKENSEMFANILQPVEQNLVEIVTFKSKMDILEKKHPDMKKENAILK